MESNRTMSSFMSQESNTSSITSSCGELDLQSFNHDLYLPPADNTSITSLDDISINELEVPPNLLAPQFDLVLVYADKDSELALRFKDILERFVELQDGKLVTVCVIDRTVDLDFIRSKFKHMSAAVARSTYMFLFMTKNFVKDSWAELQGEECLQESIEKPERRWCVIPIYTVPKRLCDYTVPFGLRALKGIHVDKVFRDPTKSFNVNISIDDITSDDLDPFFIKQMQSLLNARIRDRISREKIQKKQRINWEKKEKIRRFNTYKDEQLREKIEEEKHKRALELLRLQNNDTLQRNKKEIANMDLDELKLPVAEPIPDPESIYRSCVGHVDGTVVNINVYNRNQRQLADDISTDGDSESVSIYRENHDHSPMSLSSSLDKNRTVQPHSTSSSSSTPQSYNMQTGGGRSNFQHSLFAVPGSSRQPTESDDISSDPVENAMPVDTDDTHAQPTPGDASGSTKSPVDIDQTTRKERLTASAASASLGYCSYDANILDSTTLVKNKMNPNSSKKKSISPANRLDPAGGYHMQGGFIYPDALGGKSHQGYHPTGSNKVGLGPAMPHSFAFVGSSPLTSHILKPEVTSGRDTRLDSDVTCDGAPSSIGGSGGGDMNEFLPNTALNATKTSKYKQPSSLDTSQISIDTAKSNDSSITKNDSPHSAKQALKESSIKSTSSNAAHFPTVSGTSENVPVKQKSSSDSLNLREVEHVSSAENTAKTAAVKMSSAKQNSGKLNQSEASGGRDRSVSSDKLSHRQQNRLPSSNSGSSSMTPPHPVQYPTHPYQVPPNYAQMGHNYPFFNPMVGMPGFTYPQMLNNHTGISPLYNHGNTTLINHGYPQAHNHTGTEMNNQSTPRPIDPSTGLPSTHNTAYPLDYEHARSVSFPNGSLPKSTTTKTPQSSHSAENIRDTTMVNNDSMMGNSVSVPTELHHMQTPQLQPNMVHMPMTPQMRQYMMQLQLQMMYPPYNNMMNMNPMIMQQQQQQQQQYQAHMAELMKNNHQFSAQGIPGMMNVPTTSTFMPHIYDNTNVTSPYMSSSLNYNSRSQSSSKNGSRRSGSDGKSSASSRGGGGGSDVTSSSSSPSVRDQIPSQLSSSGASVSLASGLYASEADFKLPSHHSSASNKPLPGQPISGTSSSSSSSRYYTSYGMTSLSENDADADASLLVSPETPQQSIFISDNMSETQPQQSGIINDTDDVMSQDSPEYSLQDSDVTIHLTDMTSTVRDLQLSAIIPITCEDYINSAANSIVSNSSYGGSTFVGGSGDRHMSQCLSDSRSAASNKSSSSQA